MCCWPIRVLSAVAILCLANDADAQKRPDDNCPAGLSLHKPSGLCMSAETQNRVNCMHVVFQQAPEVLEEFATSYNTKIEKVDGKVGLALVLREGGVSGAMEKARDVANERHVTYAQRNLDACMGKHPEAIIRNQQPANHLSSACRGVRIALPQGSEQRADARRFPAARAPFEVRWEPTSCEPIVEVVARPSVTVSGDKVGDWLAGGEILIRLLDQGSRTPMTQLWVNVERPAPPPEPLPPAEPRIHVTASDTSASAQLIGSDGVRPLVMGENRHLPEGHYQLKWLSSDLTHEWELKKGGEYWAHLQLQQARAAVTILPPSSEHATLSDERQTILKEESREVSTPAADLKLSDSRGDIAHVKLAAAEGGGVKVQIEPAPRTPSYTPAWIGGGCALLAGTLWAVWLRPAAVDAERHYNGLASGSDFASARNDMQTTAMHSNVALGVAVTSLVIGAAVQAWELWR